MPYHHRLQQHQHQHKHKQHHTGVTGLTPVPVDVILQHPHDKHSSGNRRIHRGHHPGVDVEVVSPPASPSSSFFSPSLPSAYPSSSIVRQKQQHQTEQHQRSRSRRIAMKNGSSGQASSKDRLAKHRQRRSELQPHQQPGAVHVSSEDVEADPDTFYETKQRINNNSKSKRKDKSSSKKESKRQQGKDKNTKRASRNSMAETKSSNRNMPPAGDDLEEFSVEEMPASATQRVDDIAKEKGKARSQNNGQDGSAGLKGSSDSTPSLPGALSVMPSQVPDDDLYDPSVEATDAAALTNSLPHYSRGESPSLLMADEEHWVHATTVVEDDNSDLRQDMPYTYASETIDVEKQEQEQRGKRRRIFILGFVSASLVVGAVVVGVVVAVTRGNNNAEPAPTPAPTFADPSNELVGFLSSRSPDAGTAMLRAGTPQNSALQWMLNPNTNPVVGANEETTTRYVMATLFYALNGPTTWVNADGWLSADSVCTWYTSGATPCANSSLTDIDLNRNGLTGGPLPATELAMLSDHLQVLDISFNEVTGTIPTDLRLMDTLETMFLEGNFLTGTVPSFLGEMQSLDKLYVDANDLVGTVPVEVCNLDLAIFWADCNEVSCGCCTRCCVDGNACKTE